MFPLLIHGNSTRAEPVGLSSNFARDSESLKPIDENRGRDRNPIQQSESKGTRRGDVSEGERLAGYEDAAEDDH